jgi:hypothetical protein
MVFAGRVAVDELGALCIPDSFVVRAARPSGCLWA